MRNGDAYKIANMANAGVSESEICHHFRNAYSADEVKRFIPKKAAPKKAAKKKSKE